METKPIRSAELDLSELRDLLKKLEDALANGESLKAQATRVRDAAGQVGEAWSGSTMEPHSHLYFRDFQRPPFEQRFNVEWGLLYGMPGGWSDRTVPEVEQRIQELSGVELKSFHDSVEQLHNRLKELSGDVALEIKGLPPLKGTSAALAAEIGDTKWDKEEQRNHINGVLRATPNVSRDLSAITAPHCVPTHSFYESVSILLETTLIKGRRVTRATEKLLRRVQGEVETERASEGQESQPAHTHVFNVHGANARVNIHSEDKSFNAAQVDHLELFSQLRAAADAIEETDERKRVRAEVELLEKSHSSGRFVAGYQRFMSVVADHITVFAAFLPALSKLLGGG